MTAIIELEPKFNADAIGLQIHAPIKQKIAKALGLILSIVTNRDMENALNKVNGVLGLNGQHALLHVEEAIKIDHVSVLWQIIAVGLIQKHKLVTLKLVQLQLRWDCLLYTSDAADE